MLVYTYLYSYEVTGKPNYIAVYVYTKILLIVALYGKITTLVEGWIPPTGIQTQDPFW